MSKCSDLQSAVDSIDITKLDDCKKAQLLVLCKLDTLIKGTEELLKAIASRGIDSAGGSSSGAGSSSEPDFYYYKYTSINFDLMVKAFRAGKKFYLGFSDGPLQDWGEYEVDVYGKKIGTVKLSSQSLRSTSYLYDWFF